MDFIEEINFVYMFMCRVVLVMSVMIWLQIVLYQERLKNIDKVNMGKSQSLQRKKMEMIQILKKVGKKIQEKKVQKVFFKKMKSEVMKMLMEVVQKKVKKMMQVIVKKIVKMVQEMLKMVQEMLKKMWQMCVMVLIWLQMEKCV